MTHYQVGWIRFVERDGKRILQMAHEAKVEGGETKPCWYDVPIDGEEG